MRLNVGFVVFVVENVVACSAHSHFVYHLVAYLLINRIYLSRHIAITSVAHHFSILLNERSKEFLQIGNTIDGATLAVLKKEQLIEQIVGTIIERSGRKQHYLLFLLLQQTHA